MTDSSSTEGQHLDAGLPAGPTEGTLEETVLGYHGTTRDRLAGIFSTGFNHSNSQFEWLGSGIYFFQDGYEHARRWAEKHSVKDNVAVVEAKIRLGYCLDRFDESWNQHLTQMHEILVLKHRAAKMRLPSQVPERGLHALDCAVINLACAVQEKAGSPIDTVRSSFREGSPLWPRSAFHDKDHVQICVRNPAMILSVSEATPPS